MRVVAGQYKGRTLVAPPGEATRPTADKVREALFDILGPRVAGASFLDLYAGSGAVALEALSRGAARAVAVESHRPALIALEANVEKLKAPLTVEFMPVERAVPRLISQGEKFDIVFLDPPYKMEMTETLITLVPLLNDPAIVVLEHAAHSPVYASPWGATKEYKYGETKLAVWRTG